MKFKRGVKFFLLSFLSIGIMNLIYPQMSFDDYNTWTFQNIFMNHTYFYYGIACYCFCYALFYWAIPKIIDAKIYNNIKDETSKKYFIPDENKLYGVGKVVGKNLRRVNFRKNNMLTNNETDKSILEYILVDRLLFILSSLLILSLIFFFFYGFSVVSILVSLFAIFFMITTFYSRKAIRHIDCFVSGIIDGFNVSIKPIDPVIKI